MKAQVYIVGSAVLLMAYQRSRTTMDVDALLIDRRDEVLAAARRVAREQGLPEDWLNDQVRWIPILPERPDPRAQVLFDSPHLVVTGASAPHILAMKVRAARPRDMEDIEFLFRELNISTMQEVRQIHSAVYPHDGIPWVAEERVKACIREVVRDRESASRKRRSPERDDGHER